jgi:hypothetical protein
MKATGIRYSEVSAPETIHFLEFSERIRVTGLGYKKLTVDKGLRYGSSHFQRLNPDFSSVVWWHGTKQQLYRKEYVSLANEGR